MSLVGSITLKGIVFNYSCLPTELIDTLIKKLTFKKRLVAGKRVTWKTAEFYKIYEVGGEGSSKKYFVIPLGVYAYNYNGVRDLLDDYRIVDKRPPGEAILFTDPGITLNPNQVAVHDYLMSVYFNPEAVLRFQSACVLKLDTGLGKSFLGAKLIMSVGLKALVVLMNNSQVDQWKGDLFAKYYPSLVVGVYNSKSKTDGSVVLTTIHSVRKLSPSYMRQFGFILFDEIPEYMGEKFRECFWSTGARYVLGLTATPDMRLDSMDIFYKQLVGPVVDATTIPGYDVAELSWSGHVRCIKYFGPPEFTKHLTSATGDMNCSMMNEQLSMDPYRTQLILDAIRVLYDMGRNIFVFAQKREHLVQLHRAIVLMGLDLAAPEFGSSAQTLMGGDGDAEMNTAKTFSRIVLTTYSYSAVGLSIVKMDAIVFVTPRRNKMKQIIGRILRRGGDTGVTREIVDVVDQRVGLKAQYPSRKAEYKEKNFDIDVEEVSWEDIVLKDFVKESKSSKPVKEKAKKVTIKSV